MGLNKPFRVWLVFGVVVAVLVAIVALRRSAPASVILPNPNGYADFQQAATMLSGDYGDLRELSAESLKALVAANVADKFHVYVLSDSSFPEVIAEETALVEAFTAKWQGVIPVTYRRREINTAFKSGNIRDFCERIGVTKADNRVEMALLESAIRDDLGRAGLDRAVRLTGVTVSGFGEEEHPSDQLGLFGAAPAGEAGEARGKRDALNAALDALADRYGEGSVKPATLLERAPETLRPAIHWPKRGGTGGPA